MRKIGDLSQISTKLREKGSKEKGSLWQISTKLGPGEQVSLDRISRCGLNEWSSSLEQRAQVLVLVLHLNIHLLGSQIDRVTLLKYRRVVESPSPTPIKAKLSPRLQGEAVILFHEPLVAVERVKVAF